MVRPRTRGSHSRLFICSSLLSVDIFIKYFPMRWTSSDDVQIAVLVMLVLEAATGRGALSTWLRL